MGSGFLMMAGASIEAGGEAYGKASMFWLVAAYFLHTIGELCSSPVALSFITKLAPVKYASIMMGIYFAATGFGNKLAGTIGEAAQAEPVKIEFIASPEQVKPFLTDSLVELDKDFILKANIYEENGKVQLVNNQGDNKQDFSSFISMSSGAEKLLKELLSSENGSKDNQLHAVLRLAKDIEAKKINANNGDGKDYSGVIEIFEVQNEREYKIFLFITALTVLFGLLIILFLKKLKILTHGAEDIELEAGH